MLKYFFWPWWAHLYPFICACQWIWFQSILSNSRRSIFLRSDDTMSHFTCAHPWCSLQLETNDLSVSKRNCVGKVVIGHGIENDLQALGVNHEPNLLRDTMKFSKFQRKGGTAFSLKELAKRFLNRAIQQKLHTARWTTKNLQLLYHFAVQWIIGQKRLIMLPWEVLMSCLIISSTPSTDWTNVPLDLQYCIRAFAHLSFQHWLPDHGNSWDGLMTLSWQIGSQPYIVKPMLQCLFLRQMNWHWSSSLHRVDAEVSMELFVKHILTDMSQLEHFDDMVYAYSTLHDLKMESDEADDGPFAALFEENWISHSRPW